jgi:hypothetical protein
MIPMRKILCFGALALWVMVSAETPPAPVKVSTETAKSPEPPAEPEYIYSGTSRDPFIPLAGGSIAANISASVKEPGAFNPGGLDLKGLTRSRTGRWAVLVANTGDQYIVENGKIIDSKRKPVQGYVGIIKEKSLVLIGPNNQVTELRLKRDQTKEDGKKK